MNEFKTFSMKKLMELIFLPILMKETNSTIIKHTTVMSAKRRHDVYANRCGKHIKHLSDKLVDKNE